eukprot:271728_1
MLPDCGNFWVKFWEDCNDEQKGQFDIGYESNDFYDEGYVSLMSSNEICHSKSVFDIGWNKCIRTFYAKWSLIIIQKTCIMIFMPFIIIIFKIFQQKIISNICRKHLSKKK